MDNAVKDCNYVIHCASFVPTSMPKTQAEEDAIVRLAVEGTINVLKAAQKYKVTRVVVTSSTAAIIDRTKSFKGKVMSEKDWALAENATSAY